ncbi:MAG: biopolymer transporter ExbD [Acidiferrobacterales bacterium]|nr:biopolymer transporter ExbD [Acidiferrobacterales bacterium]
MRRLGKSKGEEETDIDITPMLDVVFIMLIFFIVTASFVKESGLDINNPPATNEPPPLDAPKPIVVEVSDLDEIRIQDRLVSAGAVRPTVVRLKAESPESSVVVKVDKKAKTKFVIQAIDGIRAAKVFQPTVTVNPD